METALSVFALILPLSISALVLAHLVSLLSSLFRVAFAILLLFGLVGSTVPLFVLLEKKVVDTAVANYAVNSTGVVTLINGEWITESKSLYFTHPNLRRGQWDGFHRPHWTSYQCCVCSGSRLLHPGLHDSALPTANGTSDDHRRSPDQWGHCNSCGHPPSCHCLILHESEQSRPLPRAARKL